MPLISLTRLRVRSLRFLPSFAWYTFRARRQLTRSPGFLHGSFASAPGLAFWTVTAWSDEAAMKRYRDTEHHQRAMPKLLAWCDEASVARWTQDTAALPDRVTMLQRMQADGRTSKVHHPTAEQASGQTVPDGRAPQPGLPFKPRSAVILVVAAALFSGAWQAATASPDRPPILGISHVAIQVSDLAKARAFYGDLLGFPERGARGGRRAIFIVNDRQRLIVADGLPPSRDERFSDLAFETEDVTALRASLIARGSRAADPTHDDQAGGRVITTTDPDGHAVQFVQLDRAPAPPIPGAAADGRLSTRILHAGLTVKDAIAADRFYKDALGFSETWRGGRPAGVINWINMRVPDGTDYLEYMLYPGAPPTRRQLGSAHHVALLVADIQQALESARSRTAPDDPNHRATPQIGVNNRWQLNLFDPDGTRVELMEPWTVR